MLRLVMLLVVLWGLAVVPARAFSQSMNGETTRWLVMVRLANVDYQPGERGHSLHRAIVALENIRVLTIYESDLTHLPPEIGLMRNLRGLDLRRNQLTSLPAEIGRLENLRMLDLRRNQISTLPPEIGQLHNLRWLVLSYNQLGSLPPEIGQLHSLEELYLTHNQLSTLPSELGDLRNLRTLGVGDNPLAIPVDVLNGETPMLLEYLRQQQTSTLSAND